jgi:hypothetical protein
MTNGTSGDERHRKVPAALAFSCEGSTEALWAITQFKSGKDLQLLSCSLDSWLQINFQDTTAIQQRRFVAAPRRAGKACWLVERHPKIIAAPILFEKSWNKNTPAWLYVDECKRSRPRTAEGTLKR